ncbi:hypothetical protein [Streptomyces sp. MS191]|uniref:hypothetical protein n=1 Tax=Streptomyces sp. ms191 TaxID=1827978 RepID=UPI0021C7D8FD|nr:hypothetical protein [Streptomyces sp. ms191]
MGYGLVSKMLVNLVEGCAQARTVVPGQVMWTLDGDRTVHTVVSEVTATKAREAVEVVTDHMAFVAGPELLLRTPEGWTPARDAVGAAVAWTPARKLCRERLRIRPGYDFGYFVGATCADGTVGRNYVSLIVNEEGFASRYATALTACTGLPARLETVTRPSGYLGRDLPGFRVRVVSSYLADLVRQYVGGDAHHMRQGFPRVVLRDPVTFTGFIDGYVDGDGFRSKGRFKGRMVVSANVPFLREWAEIIGARFTPSSVPGRASRLCVADSWPARGTYRPEAHPLQLRESSWVTVRDVRPRPAAGTKPFTFYSYRLAPHPTFLVNGHLVREPR